MPEIFTSSTFSKPEDRSRPVVLNLHLFQDSYPALNRPEDGINAVGGSASVHAQQARLLNGNNIMIAPSEDPVSTMLRVDIPAATFRYLGTSERNQDDWYNLDHMENVVQKLSEISHKEDILYSHMPVSGHANMELKSIQGNPHVYLGHAWELMSQKYFPERDLREQRLLSEYLLLLDSDIIVTNTKFEAESVAKMYSQYPEDEKLKEMIRRAVPTLMSEDEILAKSVPNPLGIDVRRYNVRVREMYRESKRADFLEKHNMPEDAIIIGSVGRIHPQKDPITAINTFHEVYESVEVRSKLYLVLAGPYSQTDQGEFTGYAKKVYEHLLSNHKEIADRVIFSGPARAEEINGILDIGIDTAKFETWGLSCQERLAMGLPTVGIANEVYREIYEGKGVEFVDNQEDLVQSLKKLVLDEALRETYSETCARAGQFYDWKRSVDLLKANVFDRFGIKT